jgi:hypothetical protein
MIVTQPLSTYRNRIRFFGVATISILLTACGGGSSDNTTTPTTPTTGPVAKQFADVTASSGIDLGDVTEGLGPDIRVPELQRIAAVGAAAGDYDNDGDIDLFIVRGITGSNLLYRNAGNLVFEEVAETAGVAFTQSATANYHHSGPMFADIDGDDDLDLFMGGLDGDPSLIFENNGDGTFTDVTAGSGIDTMSSTNSISASFGDYDLDGDLDLFVAHWGSPRDYSLPGDTEHLWRNDTDVTGIKFESVSEAAGISPTILTLPDDLTIQRPSDFTFAPAFARIDDDLYPDILSVADFNYSQYFVNNQDGTFTNATDTEVIIDGNGMGSAIADFDNDGDLDWFVTSIECHLDGDCKDGLWSRLGNRLYRNESGAFEDVTVEIGVESGGWGWAACFLDLENDGDLDIYHTNGWSDTDGIQDFSVDTSRAFVLNDLGQYENKAAELGLDDIEQGRGVVCADFDNDGDVDILQLSFSVNAAAKLWRNETAGNNFLRVKLKGAAPNTEAAGARITTTVNGDSQTREISIASNFVSQNPTVQTIGLGSAAQVDEMAIQWPDGRQTVVTNITANQLVTVDHPDL